MMDELEQLHHNAKQCRALADSAMTAQAHEILLDMAQDYERRVAGMNGKQTLAQLDI